jgi:hypothetical protein
MVAGWIGFSRNQYAPSSWTVFTAVSTFPNAVRTIAGGASPESRSFCNSPKPSSPGMFKSVTITSAGNSASFNSASLPSAAVSGVIPQDCIIAAKPLLWLASSSTINTRIGWFKWDLRRGATHLFYDASVQFGQKRAPPNRMLAGVETDFETKC